MAPQSVGGNAVLLYSYCISADFSWHVKNAWRAPLAEDVTVQSWLLLSQYRNCITTAVVWQVMAGIPEAELMSTAKHFLATEQFWCAAKLLFALLVFY